MTLPQTWSVNLFVTGFIDQDSTKIHTFSYEFLFLGPIPVPKGLGHEGGNAREVQFELFGGATPEVKETLLFGSPEDQQHGLGFPGFDIYTGSILITGNSG